MVIKINAKDNVCTAFEKLSAGTVVDVDGETLALLTDIPFGHKIALIDFKQNELIYKYGEVIGRVTQDIKREIGRAHV